MNWIKVTPDTMPKEYEKVIVTIKNKDGHRYVLENVEFRPDSVLGQWWYYSFNSDSYEPIDKDETITHWIPKLKPAED